MEILKDLVKHYKERCKEHRNIQLTLLEKKEEGTEGDWYIAEGQIIEAKKIIKDLQKVLRDLKKVN